MYSCKFSIKFSLETIRSSRHGSGNRLPRWFQMKVWTLLIILLPYWAFSAEFHYIKLNPELEQDLSPQFSTKRVTTNHIKVRNQLISSVLNTNFSSSIETEEPPLYQEIRRYLEPNHNNIGLGEALNIQRLNQQFNLGESNFSGLSWQKAFGSVQVQVDRQVTPNIFGENWLIMDSFTFQIEATSVLQKLNEAKIVNMSLDEIGAFAGITFRRTYTYWHYADSYQAGLMADFSKLFLPFLKFNLNQFEKMGTEEIIKKEDIWTARAGGIISSPPFYNVGFSGGVLAEHDLTKTITVQNNNNSNNKFKLGVFSKRSTTVGGSIELHLEFIKLLKLSILRYDLNYEYSSQVEISLGFNHEQWVNVKKEQDQAGELSDLLKGSTNLKHLLSYVVRLDQSSSSSLEQKGSLLIWGKLQKQKTEQVKIITNNEVKQFYKNYAQSVKVVQNIFSRIFSTIVYKLFKFPLGVNNSSTYSRQLSLEHEVSHPQASIPHIERVAGPDQFSIVFSQYYNAARTDRWVDRKFKNDLIWFVDRFTTLPKSYKTDIRNEVLKGPMLIESQINVEKAGLHFFLKSHPNEIFSHLASICGSKRENEWSNESFRNELFKQKLMGKELCVKKMGSEYLHFLNDYYSHEFNPSLASLKKFLKMYYKKSTQLSDLELLFGEGNIFIMGKLEAKTSAGHSFKTHFSSGQFRGLGVIDNFKRKTESRLPASILSESF